MKHWVSLGFLAFSAWALFHGHDGYACSSFACSVLIGKDA